MKKASSCSYTQSKKYAIINFYFLRWEYNQFFRNTLITYCCNIGRKTNTRIFGKKRSPLQRHAWHFVAMHQQGFVHHRVQGFPAWKTKVQMTSWTLNTSCRNVKYYIFRGQSEGLKIFGDEDEQQRKGHPTIVANRDKSSTKTLFLILFNLR